MPHFASGSYGGNRARASPLPAPADSIVLETGWLDMNMFIGRVTFEKLKETGSFARLGIVSRKRISHHGSDRRRRRRDTPLADDDYFDLRPGNCLVSAPVYDNNRRISSAGPTLLTPPIAWPLSVQRDDGGSYPKPGTIASSMARSSASRPKDLA